MGTLNLSNLSSILIDGDSAKIDLGLIHAKSKVERGIKFTSNHDAITEGKTYWIIWITVDRNDSGSYYAGAAACSMIIDVDKRQGWKNLAEHVNRMDSALKRKFILQDLPKDVKEVLLNFLISYDEKIWGNSASIKAALS